MKKTCAATIIKVLISLILILFPITTVAADADEFARLRALADSFHATGHSDSAIVEAGRALDMARRSNNASGILGTHTSLGVYLRSLGRIDEALKHYDEALKIATTDSFRKQADDEAREEAAALYVNLATLHLDMAHKDEAVKYAVTATKWAEKCHDNDYKGQIFSAAGPILIATGQTEKALELQKKAYDYALKAENDDAALKAAAFVLLSCDRLDRTAEAAEWRKTCQGLLPRVENVLTRLAYYQTECSISLRHDNPRAAISWFDSILHLDGIGQFPFVVFDCYNNMHKAYADLGSFREAYETLLKGNAVRDSLYEQQKAESMRELTVKYDTKEKELALALSEASRANTRFWLAVALGLLAVAAALFAVYSLRQRQRRRRREAEFELLRRDTERRLTARYIEGLETERARMARELHDGVCNDLTGIRMILANEHPSSPSLDMLGKCRDQVRRISHELMPPEFTYATIDEVLRYYVSQLDKAADNCHCTYTSSADGADWAAVPDHVALEIYRIVQEAAGNALKHASARHIKVDMTATGHHIKLTVSDDGTARQAHAAGIGRRTMSGRAAAVGGRLTVESGNGGTVVVFTLKLFQ